MHIDYSFLCVYGVMMSDVRVKIWDWLSPFLSNWKLALEMCILRTVPLCDRIFEGHHQLIRNRADSVFKTKRLTHKHISFLVALRPVIFLGG